jgi:hypothetical protein
MAAKSVEQAGLGWLSLELAWFETQKLDFFVFFFAQENLLWCPTKSAILKTENELVSLGQKRLCTCGLKAKLAEIVWINGS